MRSRWLVLVRLVVDLAAAGRLDVLQSSEAFLIRHHSMYWCPCSIKVYSIVFLPPFLASGYLLADEAE